MLLLDAKLQVVLANRAATLLFRTTAARVRGAAVAQLLPHVDLTVLLRHLNTRGVNIIETPLQLKRRQAVSRTLKISAVQLAQRGKPRRRVRPSVEATSSNTFTLLVLEDITEKATLEQQLVDSEKQAAMGQLAAGLLHEVANPLRSLGSNLLFVRSALQNPIDEAIAQALDTSLDQLEQMRQLLGTLSALPGRAAPRYEHADLHQVVRQCVTFIAKDAEHRRVSIAVAFAPAALVCEMDVRLIKQVLLNLFKNALEAMPDGGRIDVRTSERRADTEPPSVLIEVADTGVGIAEPDLRRVFRPLFSTKRRGAGLGLSFCRQAVEEHGGEIRLMSGGRNCGATALVSLPLRQPVLSEDVI